MAQGTFVVMAKTIVPKPLGFALISGSVTTRIKHLDRPSPKDYKEYSTFSLYVLDSGVAFSILFYCFMALTEMGMWLTPNASLEELMVFWL